MTLGVFLAVLAAAVMHAAWNALIKVRLDRFMSISLMTLGMGIAALPALPYVGLPSGMIWFWIAVSTVLHTCYRLSLVKAYDTGDLSQIYPLARGSAPLLTTLGGIVLLREMPSGVAIAGILLLSGGTFLMSVRGGHIGADRRSVRFALTTSLFIAGYTLTDGNGARLAATASTYAAWLFAVDAVWTLCLCLVLRGRSVAQAVAAEWKIAIVGGALSGAAYWIAIWAMTKAPVASVAALRETSILFAMGISIVALKETVTRWRIAAALLIVAGVVVLKLA